MDWSPSRRRFLRASAAVAGAGLLQAYGTSSTSQPAATNNPQKAKPVQPISSSAAHHGDDVLRVVAPSGFAEDINRVSIGLTRLYDAGFIVTNQETGSRRYQRLAGTDVQRIADPRNITAGRVRTPKVLMEPRGGCGAARILLHIDFASLGVRIRERGTLFFGFNDIYAVRLALLAKGNVPSFVGPMVYSEFDKPRPSTYTMDSLIRGSTSAGNTVDIPVIQCSDVNAEGTFQGGSLSVLASLAGSSYMPSIQDDIPFIEDMGEQPYRIERMLNTLYLAGVLQKQRAVVFGDFRMDTIRDVYDSSYDFPSVVSQIQRTIHVSVLTGFPPDHIANKSTSPLGAYAKICSSGNGGYSVTFSGYPTLNAAALNLSSLLPPPVTFGDCTPAGNGTTEEVLE